MNCDGRIEGNEDQHAEPPKSACSHTQPLFEALLNFDRITKWGPEAGIGNSETPNGPERFCPHERTRVRIFLTMAGNNKLELVVEVDVNNANASIKSVNTGLSGMEQAAAKAARGASAGIDGMRASMVKGAAGVPRPYKARRLPSPSAIMAVTRVFKLTPSCRALAARRE